MFSIKGKILVQETSLGIADLVVRAIDVDSILTKSPGKSFNPTTMSGDLSTYDSLGSVMTMKDGSFEINFEMEDFRLGGNEQRHDIYLAVLAPYDVINPEDLISTETTLPVFRSYKAQRTALFFVEEIRFDGGRSEAYVIRIPSAVLDHYKINYSKPEDHLSEFPKITASTLNSFLKLPTDLDTIFKTLSSTQVLSREKIKTSISNHINGSLLSRLSTRERESINYASSKNDLISKREQHVKKLIDQLSLPEAKVKTQTFILPSHILSDFPGLNTSNTLSFSGSVVHQWLNQLTGPALIRKPLPVICQKPNSESLEPTSNIVNTTNIENIQATDIDIKEQISHQLATQSSPENPLAYNVIVPENDHDIQLNTSIKKFRIPAGPADVTAYHDFQQLEIAMGHTWTEVFDKKLQEDGKSLYEAHVRLQQSVSGRSEEEIKYMSVETVDDLKQLAAMVREDLSAVAPVPVLVHKHFPDVADWEWARMTNEERMIMINFSQGADSSSVRPYGYRMQGDAFMASVKNRLKDEQTRLDSLMVALDKRLSEPYRFDIFAPDSINYGTVMTWRQAWEPLDYQVGSLLSTIPLAPKEVRRYSVKNTSSIKSMHRESNEEENKNNSESTSNNRIDTDIVNRSASKTTMSLNINTETPKFLGAGSSITAGYNRDSERSSERSKKNLREAALKSSQEYRSIRKTEVEVNSTDEISTESSGEIFNPNDEITVTYLFYELQRQYAISEQLHKVEPVVLVANSVPSPAEIDNDWLMANSWIIRKALLDSSFHVAIHYLENNLAGDEMQLQSLRQQMEEQGRFVQEASREMELANDIAKNARDSWDMYFGVSNATMDENRLKELMQKAEAMAVLMRAAKSKGLIKRKLKAGQMEGTLEASVDREELEANEAESKFAAEMEILRKMTERYSSALKSFIDKQTAVGRLRIHIKDNILHYMQAIWDEEPADQRYFRLYNIEVDWLEPLDELNEGSINKRSDGLIELTYSLPNKIKPVESVPKRPLHEVADLDNLLGYKGNYMVFPARERNAVHSWMMSSYIDPITGGVKDPDLKNDRSIEEWETYLSCLQSSLSPLYNSERERFATILEKKRNEGIQDKELIIVPSDAVYIEALPGATPIIENFKLAHRSLDVKKVQAEVRMAELENIRLAARLMYGEHEDPKIDKKVVIENFSSNSTIEDELKDGEVNS